jgi:hypothetical protein
MLSFGQGAAKTSENGETLQSGSHMTCYSLMLLNLETRKAQMHHVWEGEYNGFSPEQRDEFSAFMRDLGKIVAVIVEGDRSRVSYNTRYVLVDNDIELVQVHRIDANGAWWSSEFKPHERQVKISLTNEGTTLYEGTPFPKFEEVPESERDLSIRERLVSMLTPYVDLETGELPTRGIEVLKNLLGIVNGKPRYEGMYTAFFNEHLKKRAQAAGFDNFQDYVEADRSNFYKIPPQNPEWVLRKLIGIPSTLPEHFRHAAENTKITASLLADMFEAHPRQILKLINLMDKEGLKPAQQSAPRLMV